MAYVTIVRTMPRNVAELDGEDGQVADLTDSLASTSIFGPFDSIESADEWREDVKESTLESWYALLWFQVVDLNAPANGFPLEFGMQLVQVLK